MTPHIRIRFIIKRGSAPLPKRNHNHTMHAIANTGKPLPALPRFASNIGFKPHVFWQR